MHIVYSVYWDMRGKHHINGMQPKFNQKKKKDKKSFLSISMLSFTLLNICSIRLGFFVCFFTGDVRPLQFAFVS